MEEVKTYQASSIGCKNDDPSFSKFFPTKDQAVDCLMTHILKVKKYNWTDIKNIYTTILNYGVYEFKKGFGGRVVEYIGEFDLIISPFKNTTFEFSAKLMKYF